MERPELGCLIAGLCVAWMLQWRYAAEWAQAIGAA